MTRTAWLTTAGDRLDAMLAEARLDDAEALAHQLLGIKDEHLRAVIALARCAAAHGNIPTALRWSERAARLDPDDHSLAAFHGTLLVAAGRRDVARPILERLLAVTPLAMPGVALAQLLLLDGDARTVELLARLLADYPVSATPHLANLAGAVVEATERPGWVAVDLGTRLAGAIRRPAGTGDGVVWIGVPGASGTDAERRTLLTAPLGAFLARFADAAEADGRGGSSLIRFSVTLDAEAGRLAGAPDLRMTLDGVSLFGPPLRLPRRLEAEGAVDVDGGRLYGWAWLPGNPQASATLRITDAQGRSIQRAPDQRLAEARSLGLDEGRQAFSIDLMESGLAPGLLTVTAGPEDTPLTGSPLRWTEGRLQTVPMPIGPRPRRDGTVPIVPAPIAPAGAIDILIPVYAGRAETMACLQAVLESVAGLPCDVVVIEDASPEPALVEDLRALAAQGRITLLSNARNLGFPATVNRGFQLHPDRDVVLLNADTLVAGDWLTRLRAAAYSAPDIGTVTPFSNDATILSYPGGDEEDDAPPGPEETAALHDAAARANNGRVIDLPTAVAFCTYIRRDCLTETGPFEEVLFGRGYGEENDFCLRAHRLGWRHVAAADAFVAHVGGRSFGRHKRVLTWRNIRVLNRLHPGYDALVGDFLKRDPLAGARRGLDLARWMAPRRTGGAPAPLLGGEGPADVTAAVLVITLDLGGGVSRHIGERRHRHADEGLRTLLLAPHAVGEDGPPELCRLEDPQRRDLRHLIFRTAEEIDLLVGVLRRAGVVRVEIHHALNHDPSVLDLPSRLGVPYDMVIHDYSWICPRITMIGMDGRYCGEPAPSVCELCAVQPGPRIDEAISVADLRHRSARLIAGARRVIVPSGDVARRLSRHVPGAALAIEDWDAAAPAPRPRPPRPPGERWRICLIGAIGDHKGRTILLECARDAVLRDLPLEFVIVGYTDDDGPLFATGRVFVTGRFREEEGEALVRAQDAHLAFLPSICPETWCYALSTAWKAGLEAVAFDIGAIAERIGRKGGGWLLPTGLTAAAINDALIGVLDDSTPSGVALLPVGDTVSATPVCRNAPSVEADSASTRPQSSEGTSPMFGSVTAPVSAPASDAQLGQITATAQKIIFKPGLFSVVVVGGGGVTASDEFPLPSIHLAEAPNNLAGGRVSILGSQPGGWLAKPGDALVVKVEGEPVNMILTSYTNGKSPESSLNIQITRMDVVPAAPGAAPAMPAVPVVPAAPVVPAPPRTVPLDIMMHMQRVGDLKFSNGDWAGSPGQRLWVEGFAIVPTGALAPGDIEYKALTANGWETPWVEGGKLCGSRGMGTPLVGFAIRLRGAAAERFDCLYEGAFVSGQRTTQYRNGTPCRSDVIGDPLEGMLLRVVEKGAAA